MPVSPVSKSVYSETWVVLQCGGFDIHLLKKEVGTPGAGGEPRHFGRHWTPVHLDFGADDIDEAMLRVMRWGGSVDDFSHGEAADIAHKEFLVLVGPYTDLDLARQDEAQLRSLGQFREARVVAHTP